MCTGPPRGTPVSGVEGSSRGSECADVGGSITDLEVGNTGAAARISP
jgi:hypothetical protein